MAYARVRARRRGRLAVAPRSSPVSRRGSLRATLGALLRPLGGAPLRVAPSCLRCHPADLTPSLPAGAAPRASGGVPRMAARGADPPSLRRVFVAIRRSSLTPSRRARRPVRPAAARGADPVAPGVWEACPRRSTVAGFDRMRERRLLSRSKPDRRASLPSFFLASDRIFELPHSC